MLYYNKNKNFKNMILCTFDTYWIAVRISYEELSILNCQTFWPGHNMFLPTWTKKAQTI